MNRPEQDLHKAVAAHLKKRAVPGLVYFHVPNQGRMGGQRGMIQGSILRSLGVRAGVSDFILLHDSKFFALELKAPKGRATEEQLGFIQDVNGAGGFATVAAGLDSALSVLEMWGLLR